jgi:hypothetical protein
VRSRGSSRNCWLKLIVDWPVLALSERAPGPSTPLWFCVFCSFGKCKAYSWWITLPSGRPDELEIIRLQVESGFEPVEAIDPEIREIVKRNWPHLLAKLPPEDDDHG